MHQYKKEIAFILSALVFCFICAIIVAVFIRSDAELPIEYETYDIIYGPNTELTPETMVYEDEITDPIFENMPDGISYRRVFSRTILNTDNGSRLILNYPRFSGFENGVDIALNELIRYYIDDMYRVTGEGMHALVSSGAKVMYELSDFKIGYIDRKMISIMFEGTYDVESEGEHIDSGIEHFGYSLNIDLEKMNVLSSEQLLSDYILLRKRICDGMLTQTHGNDKLLENTTYTNILSQYGDKRQIYPDLFFEEDSVSVIVSLTSDLGGYAVFSDTREAGKDYINKYLVALSQYLQ